MLGHLGGFITGALTSLFLLPGLGDAPSDIQHHKSCKKVGIWSSIIFCIALLVSFYTLREPAQGVLSIDELTITEETMPLDTNSTEADNTSATVEEIDDTTATVEEVGEDADEDDLE